MFGPTFEFIYCLYIYICFRYFFVVTFRRKQKTQWKFLDILLCTVPSFLVPCLAAITAQNSDVFLLPWETDALCLGSMGSLKILPCRNLGWIWSLPYVFPCSWNQSSVLFIVQHLKTCFTCFVLCQSCLCEDAKNDTH